MANQHRYPACNLLCMSAAAAHAARVALISGMFSMLAHCNHLDTGGDSLELVFGHVHELTRPLVGCCIAQQVQRCQPRLPPAVSYNNTESWPLRHVTVTCQKHTNCNWIASRSSRSTLALAFTDSAVPDGRHVQHCHDTTTKRRTC